MRLHTLKAQVERIQIICLGESLYYVAAVKITFSAMSLFMSPWSMYVFGRRRHWGKQTARLALLLGCSGMNW